MVTGLIVGVLVLGLVVCRQVISRAQRIGPEGSPSRVGAEVPGMRRRTLLGAVAVLPLFSRFFAPAHDVAGRRVRAGEPGWPGPAEWAALGKSVGGRLVRVVSPFVAAELDPGGPATAELFRSLRDPFYIQENVALTQTLGWTDAWTSEPSVYAVLAQSSADVAAAVNFAGERCVRLVVKGVVTAIPGARMQRIRCSSGLGPTCGRRGPRPFRAPGVPWAGSRLRLL